MIPLGRNNDEGEKKVFNRIKQNKVSTYGRGDLLRPHHVCFNYVPVFSDHRIIKCTVRILCNRLPYSFGSYTQYNISKYIRSGVEKTGSERPVSQLKLVGGSWIVSGWRCKTFQP